MVLNNKRSARQRQRRSNKRRTTAISLSDALFTSQLDDGSPELAKASYDSSSSDSDDESDISLGSNDSDSISNSDSDDSDDDEPPPLLPRLPRDDFDSINDLKDLEDIQLLQQSALDIRNNRWDHGRLDWDAHVEQLLHEDKFVNEYTMSVPAHGKLVRILEPTLMRKEYNSRCSEPISVEHITAIGLRVLAGGRTKDQRHIIGTSLTAAYDAVDDFIDAVNCAPELDIHLPQTMADWYEINEGFKRKSTHEIIAGCVGALDGFFQRTNKPSSVKVGNVLSYYSGHYESYGVNCQACIRSDLRFTYFGIVSPGSTNDNISYPLASGLKQAFDNLPLGLYGVADAAYTLSENMLIPFTGVNRLDPANDAFNYYLSQLRIRVEMAFGRLVNKFRILNGKIEGSLDRVTAILTACARLHNYIIGEDGPFEAKADDVVPHPSAPLGLGYLPVVPDETFEVYNGVSRTREAIVEFLREKDIRRPLHNIERKKREQSMVVSAGGLEIDREFISPI